VVEGRVDLSNNELPTILKSSLQRIFVDVDEETKESESLVYFKTNNFQVHPFVLN
jgi:hypothetical protein